VIAGVIPIDILAQERRFIYQNKDVLDGVAARRTARANSMLAWQQRWDQETRGRWTARLIGQLEAWLNRLEGEVNYYLTQFLSGHGLFRAYLHKMGKVDRPSCVFCDFPFDDALRTFFQCANWDREREALQQSLGGSFSPDNAVSLMLRGKDDWARVSGFVESVLRQKKRDMDPGLRATN
jgi:hypothetical protein